MHTSEIARRLAQFAANAYDNDTYMVDPETIEECASVLDVDISALVAAYRLNNALEELIETAEDYKAGDATGGFLRDMEAVAYRLGASLSVRQSIMCDTGIDASDFEGLGD